MAIDRRPLRELIRQEVLDRLGRGEFDSGRSLNEAKLAAELGVSRTPLREALIALEMEGVISSEPGKGFRFSPVSRQEYAELCPVVAALESLALELTDPEYLRSIAPRALQLAVEFSDSVAAQQVIEEHDDEWHELLLSGCPNERLLDLITTVKASLRRYVHLKVADSTQLRRSASEHQRIAERLLAGDLPGAIVALRQNWASGAERVMEKLPASDEAPNRG